MRKFVLYVLLLAVAIGAFNLTESRALAQNAAGAAGLYKQGREEFLKFTPEGFDKAISLYNHAIKADPNYAQAYAGLAEVYSFMGYYRYQVREEYEKFYNDSYVNMAKALQINPNLEEVQLALAYSYLQLSREKDAKAAAQKILAKNPNNAEAMYILWSASGENPDSPEIRKVLQLSPKFVPAYVGLGNALFFKKRAYGQATENFRKAAEIAPSAQIHNLFGTALRTQGHYNEAIDEYEKAIKENPNYAPAYMNLGITYYYLNKFNQNIENQKKAISLNPNYPDAYFFIAQGYEKANNPQQAVVYYKKFLDVSLEQEMYAGYAAQAKQRISALGGAGK
ncbi:MAG: tetratricopeptide repeat protein [Thermodesulfobacteriota bacterium]